MAEKKAEEKKEVDYIKKIGRNLNPTNAAAIFGNDNVDRVFAAVEKTRIWGRIDKRQLPNGLAIPPGDTPRQREHLKTLNEALNNL